MPHSVLVTRPAHQNRLLIERLQEEGFRVIEFPTIEISAVAPSAYLQELNAHIQDIDIALFVSRNAVDHAFRYLDPRQLPATLQLGVIGKGSWIALNDQGVTSQIIPAQNYNSEGLLATDALQSVHDKRVLIFRGQQGRNLLGDTLRERGAEVKYVEVYRRGVPRYAKGEFERRCRGGFPDLAIYTSAEGLGNCFSLLNGQEAQRMCAVDWLLISERMRETARQLGHNAAIVIADSASDEGILTAVQAWRKQQV